MADEATCGWTRNGSVRFIQVLKFVKSFSWILRWLKFLECQAFCLSDGQSTKSCRVRHSLKSGFLQHVSMVLGITFWEGISDGPASQQTPMQNLSTCPPAPPQCRGKADNLGAASMVARQNHIQGSSKTKYLKQEGQVRDASNKNMNQVAGVREVQVPQRRQEFS